MPDLRHGMGTFTFQIFTIDEWQRTDQVSISDTRAVPQNCRIGPAISCRQATHFAQHIKVSKK
jgi:hypothetical protein